MTPPTESPVITPSFAALGAADQVARIEAVLDASIRGGLAGDGGGVTIEDWDGSTLSVKYMGACVGCKAAAGATLSFIATSLTRELGHPIKVVQAATC